MADRIEARARFDLIRYANCWEDADILCRALAPAPGKRILSIASGGDNSFALLADGAEVVAADISPPQLACVELKREAIRGLDHAGFLAFLGVLPGHLRPSTYRELRARLSAPARAFWDAHPAEIDAGIVHAGKFERFFGIFRRWVLPFIHGRSTAAGLLAPRSAAERRAFYASRWNTVRWRLLFRVFFSRRVMGRLGRDPGFFQYVEGSVADRILARAEYALTELPAHENPYLRFILEGNYGPTLPRYLRPERYRALQGALDRLELHQGPVEEAARRYGARSFDGFNLSDIFEYLDPATGRAIHAELLESARPGARLAYWNMLARRDFHGDCPGRVKSLDALAAELFAADQAFFYSAFRVEEAA